MALMIAKHAKSSGNKSLAKITCIINPSPCTNILSLAFQKKEFMTLFCCCIEPTIYCDYLLVMH